MSQLTEGGLTIGLIEGEIPDRICVISDRVGKLFQDDDDPDPREHSCDHRRWEVVGDDSRLGVSEGNRDQPCEDDGNQEDVERAKVLDGSQDDDGKSGSWTRDAQRRATEGSNDNSTNSPCDEPGDERCD